MVLGIDLEEGGKGKREEGERARATEREGRREKRKKY